MPDELFHYSVEKLGAMRLSQAAPCKICGGDAEPFDIVDFNKACDPSLYSRGLSAIPVIYRSCRQCQFIFTDFFDTFTGEQWRKYVYNAEYAELDPDYLHLRPRTNARIINEYLGMGHRKDSIIGLDFGGGNGKTAALLRAVGWKFDTFDPFDFSDVPPTRVGTYNFCSALEVFEHIPDPVGSLRSIIEMSSRDRLIIMIGTLLNDHAISNETRLSWWYIAPRNGHVSCYSLKSLQILGAQFGLTCTSVGRGPVLLTRGYRDVAIRSLLMRGLLSLRIRRILNLWSRALK